MGVGGGRLFSVQAAFCVRHIFAQHPLRVSKGFMAFALNDGPALNDQNFIGRNDSGKSARGHQHRDPLRNICKASRDFLFGLGNERRRCFVKDKNPRLFYGPAGDQFPGGKP